MINLRITFYMILLCLASGNALAMRPSHIDKMWVDQLVKESKDFSFKKLKQDFKSLSSIFEGSNNVANNAAKIKKSRKSKFITSLDKPSLDNALDKSQLRIFVSSSMSPKLLKQYYRQAARYGGILVFKGLPNGGFREFGILVQKIVGTSNIQDKKSRHGLANRNGLANDLAATIQIDDQAFKEFAVSSVPTIILSMRENDWSVGNDNNSNNSNKTDGLIFDKVSGNISLNKTLRLFAGYGELAEIAAILLEKNG